MAGVEVRHSEAWSGPAIFLDVGAIVFFLRAVPWVVQDFSLQRDLGSLEALQAQLESGRPLRFTSTRFLIEAVKT